MTAEAQVKISRWHGLDDDQSLALWAQHHWQPHVRQLLYEVASCEVISSDTRLTALGMLSASAQAGLLPGGPEVAAFICSVLVEMTKPRRRLGWLARRRALRLEVEMAGRMRGASNIINTVVQFRSSKPQLPAIGFSN